MQFEITHDISELEMLDQVCKDLSDHVLKNERDTKSWVFALSGELGLGKTTFVKHFCFHYLALPLDQVSSPTYTYHHIYQNQNHVVNHMDLYRIDRFEKLRSLGLMDVIGQEGVCMIEWYDRFKEHWDKGVIEIQFEFDGLKRFVTISLMPKGVQ